MDPERMAFVEALAKGLVHEIRTPLSTLAVNLQLLAEDWQNGTTAREAQSLKRVQMLLKETRRLEDVLNDFLRFAGGHQLVRIPAQLNAVIAEVLDFIQPEAQRGAIEVRREFAANLPPVPLDVNLFKQALMNLLANARQAMPRGGTLTVETLPSARGRSVQVRIHDTGEGIPADVLPRIFDVYFSTKRRGTGLGLPTTKRIIEEHGGTLSVSSDPGRGACFSVELPLSIPPECDTDAARP